MEGIKYKLKQQNAEVKPICGHKLFFPVMIAIEASQKSKTFVFHHQCPMCFKKHLITIREEKAFIQLIPDAKKLIELYEGLEGKEHTFTDPNGVFYAKEICSHHAITELE